MRLPKSLNSAAFRFALLLAAIVALGAGALLLTVERQIGHYAHEASDGMLRTEASVLAGEYRDLGLSGLTDAIERHQAIGENAPYRFLLRDAAGRRLAGTLPASAARLGPGAIIVTEMESGGPSRERLATLGTDLPDGLLLVVATDSFDIEDLGERLGRFTLWSGIAIAVFALLGGYLVGRVFLGRLDRVNRAVDGIIDGNRIAPLPMIGLGAEFDDLTRNLNRMLDRIAQTMEALRQMSSDVAHDLRTPLTRLHQRLERMRDTEHIDPAAVDEMLEQTTALLATFQALLRIGTLEGGVGRQRFGPVDLTEVMDRVVQAYCPVAEDARHRLVAQHAGGVRVDGDAELLAQLVTNLIENAIVHTPPGTEITSRLSVKNGRPCIDLCDDGPGIPVEHRDKVFRRFYRGDASRSTEGAGLGLALVAAIAGLHRASSTIRDVGRGLCVRVTFPPSALQVTGAP